MVTCMLVSNMNAKRREGQTDREPPDAQTKGIGRHGWWEALTKRALVDAHGRELRLGRLLELVVGHCVPSAENMVAR